MVGPGGAPLRLVMAAVGEFERARSRDSALLGTPCRRHPMEASQVQTVRRVMAALFGMAACAFFLQSCAADPPAPHPGPPLRDVGALEPVFRGLASQTRADWGMSLNENSWDTGTVASISWASQYGPRGMSYQATVCVDPTPVRTRNENTWGFILGHEMGHAVCGHLNGSPSNEREADIEGAKMAIAAGYDLDGYVGFLLSQPNSCSASHGCWHRRAYEIAKACGRDTSWYDGWAHDDCAMAKGLPGGTTAFSGCLGR